MPAYVIGQLNIHAPEEYQKYLAGFEPVFAKYGGDLLATTKQKTATTNLVIVEGLA